MRPSIVLLALLLLVSSVSAQTSGRWLRNDVTGCSVWDSDPEAGKTFNWAGNCASNVADGPGVLQWYVNGALGDRYVGQYENGRMSGRGVFEYRNGDRYDGKFRDDQPNGYGTLSRANGTHYTGMFRDGEPLQPETALAAPNKYDVELREGLTTRVEVTDADGSRYEGEMRNDETAGASSGSPTAIATRATSATTGPTGSAPTRRPTALSTPGSGPTAASGRAIAKRRSWRRRSDAASV